MTQICFICPGLYHYLNPTEGVAAGGSQRQQYLLLKGLAERGYEVSVILGDNGQPFHDSVQGVDIWRGIKYTQGFKKAYNIYPLLKAMRAANPDIFYLRGAPQLFTTASLLNEVGSSKIIFSLSNDSNIDPDMVTARYNKFFIRLYKSRLDEADYVIAQTENQHKMLSQEGVADIRTIPNGYSIPSLDEIEPPDSRDYVLWVGSTDEQKRPDRLLELVSKTPSVNYLIICRNKTSTEAYNQLRTQFESYDNVDFMSEVSPHNIHQYYKEAAILINTSDYEGFPNTFLEAWRYGTPIVSTEFDVDGLLKEGSVGELSGSLEQMVTDVVSLYQSPESQKKMGALARDLIQNKYDIERVLDQYEEVIDEI